MAIRRPLALLTFAFAIRAFAQTPPAPPPAPDLSSPAAALTSAYAALRAGDIPTAQACLAFQSPAQAELFDITYTQLYGPLKLMHAMEASFGDAGRKPFANAPFEKSLAALIEKIKTTDFKIEGNTASVADKKAAVNPNAESELTGITFKKEVGPNGRDQWKIVATTFSDVSGDIPPTQLAFMRALRDATNSATTAALARLAAKDFKSADEAYADYQSRLQEATKLAATNATQPAKKP